MATAPTLATLSPAAMLVRAGMMHDDGNCLMDAVQMADFWRVFAILPGDNEDAVIDAAWAELASDPVSVPPAPAPAPAPRTVTTTTNDTGAKVTVDTRNELFGDAVTIAHLAAFTFNGHDSHGLTVYEAAALLNRDWRDEITPDSMELENGTGTRVRFKDGSALSVGAWADCCTGEGYCRQCWDGKTRFDGPTHH